MTSKDPLRSRIFTCRGKNLLSLLLAFFSVFSESLSQAQQLAFPGAQGYGQYATGGRGGTVYHVTSLADDGSAGTFRQAVSQGNRTIVFDVGGYIVLNSAVSCAGGITIAGQTAPGGGIGVMNNEVSFYNDNNIICRFFRFRQGGSSTGSSGINIGSGNISTNMIFDHVSVEFGQWDNIDAVHTAYATVQNSIIADPIHQQFGAHVEGYNLTWYGNIWANEHNRQPLCKADTIFINNVVYDYAAAYTTGDTGASHNHDIINNYFITGPSSTAPQDDFFQMNGTPQNLYFTGNLLDSDNNGILGGGTTTPSPDNNGRSGNILSAPWSPVTPTIPTFPTVTAYHMDVTQAGALPRDPLDAQVVSQVMSLGGSGSIMTSPANTGLPNGGYGTIDGGTALVDSDQDGMPDVWESATGSNPLVADNNVVAADGYTLLEHYLNWLAAPHAFIQTNATDIDLWPYTLGFTNGATYSVSGASNGTVTITNLHFAHFVPNSGYTGLAGFNFSVTAGDGSSMTNTMGLLVSIVYVPKNLVWRGDGSANVWDTTNTPNWFNGNDLVTFNTTDSVTFDDTGSANPAVNITAAVSPSSVAFNSTQNYTLGGTGGISGTCKLTKTGTGTLTVSNANTFTGGTLFQGGAIVIGGGGSIGTGPITFQNNTLTCTAGPTANFTLGNTLNIPTGTTNNLYISARASFGPATNGGTLNVIVPGTVDQYDYVQGGWTPFTGTLNITGSVPNALLDLHFNGGNFDGGWGTTILNLNSVTLVGHHNSGGNTLNIGALNGTASSVLAGSEYAGPESWKIGGLNIDCTFAGSISNYTGTTNVLTKIGTGNLTLSGTNTLFGAMVVSNGTLTVSGSISNCLVTVANGSTVRGTGFFGGGLAIQAGGNVLPGILNGQAGTITVSNGLTLASPNLFFDLSSSPAGANDYIAMQGGSLAMSGVNNYIFYPINGYYGAGTYDLIDGATTSTAWSGVTDNLPGNTRQTFNLFRAVAGSNPSYVRLSVTGSASSLVWQGTNGNNWDNVTTNWLNGSSSDKYYNLDLVQFDDTSTNGNVNIVGVIQPATVVVTNSALNYTFGGGVLAGFTGITKNGPGMLTLNSSNSFSGGCLVNGGTLQLVTNVYAGGTGPITLNGGTLFLNGVGTPTTVSCVGSNMLQTYGQPYAGFGLQGSGQLNLNIGGGGVFSPYGDWSKFSGTINFTTGAWMRQLAAPVFGSSNAFWNFGPGGGIYNKYGGCTVYLGAVYGGASTEMGGATTATASLTTYVIGGVNSNSVFNGAITDGGAAATALVYNGPGSLTLTGSNTFSGTTTVNGGALYINNTTGSGTGSGQVNLNGGATLGGSGTISGVVIAIGGGILVPGNNGYGTLTVSNDVSLDSASVLQFTLGTNSSQVFVSGNLTLGGTVNIVKSGGFGPGTYTLFNYGGALSISTLNLGTTPAGYTCVLDTTSVQGQVNLVVSLPSFNNPVAGPAGLVMSGSGGNSNATYYLLGSTNIATPVSNWTRLLTNHFDGSGNFSLTNPIDPNTPQSFYLLQLQ